MMRRVSVLLVALLMVSCAPDSGQRPAGPGEPPVEVRAPQTGKADGFDWGSGCDGGDGSFTQDLAKNAVVTVGTIPAQMSNVEISLSSDEDVDIQLIDADGTKVVHWPDGILSEAGAQSTTYKGLTITWTGYNGDGTGKGHETIRLEGVTQNAFEMKAYGYAAGQARVSYSWDATPNCVDQGSGSFEQQIEKDAVVTVGEIPAGKSDIRIQLQSPVDIDVQLYDADGTKVVHWPDGILSGADQQSTTYKGVKVTWSGYNGDGTGKGNETIELKGTTQNDFVMKVFGYQAGTATVSYSWGKLDSADVQVRFSPTSTSTSHVARVVELMDQAQHSLDIAIYSLSDSRINKALERAVQRGVKVRMVFHGAQEDRKDPPGTKSAKLEDVGVDVRYATKSKVMHHKFLIVDGPRKGEDGQVDLARAESATLVTGSGNWSHGAQVDYDENTLFINGVPELVLRYQQEFNRLWNYAYDFIWKPFNFVPAASVDPADVADDPDADALFTSANFKKNQTFTVISDSYLVAEALAAAIEQAQTSVYIASGHLRSWPIYDALVQLKQQRPQVDIKVYLDSQEYISAWYDGQQEDKLQACLTAAGSDAQDQLECRLSGMYYSYRLHQAGIPLRFKTSCFRWDYHYAKQMHHKYMIIDGKTLLTGSYNYSDNAERGTLENVVRLEAPRYASVVQQYVDNFNQIWNTDGDGALLAQLQNEIQTADVIPLTFPPMALSWTQVGALKELIAANCPAVYSDPYKQDPNKHRTCPRAQ